MKYTYISFSLQAFGKAKSRFPLSAGVTSIFFDAYTVLFDLVVETTLCVSSGSLAARGNLLLILRGNSKRSIYETPLVTSYTQ